MIEMSANSCLVPATVPGIERQPMKKLKPDAPTVLKRLQRSQIEALKAGRKISRFVVALESGRDSFWLARWLIVRGRHACHHSAVLRSREAKARQDRSSGCYHVAALVLGWLGVSAVIAGWWDPTLEEEEARRPSREERAWLASEHALPTASRVR